MEAATLVDRIKNGKLRPSGPATCRVAVAAMRDMKALEGLSLDKQVKARAEGSHADRRRLPAHAQGQEDEAEEAHAGLIRQLASREPARLATP